MAVLLVPLTAGTARAAGQAQATIARWAQANPSTSALVWRLDAAGPTPVAAYRADVPRIPASTIKLATAAGALLQLGPGHRFRTELHAGSRTVRQGAVLRGPLYLRGAGDPVLATGSYARRYLSGRATRLGDLVRPLRTSGIRLVRGPLIADEGLFDSRRMGPGWPSYYRYYSAPLSALATNQGFAGNARARHVANPPRAAAQRLRAALAGVGIRQRGGLRAGATPPRARRVASAVSPPLRTIVRAMNVSSDNFIAETLVKGVGAYGAGRGTTQAGAGRTAALLRARAILARGDRLVDGSGLSRANRLSASSLVRLISAADADRTWGAALLGSLARGGEGTLVRRFRTGPATRRVRGKTGYLSGVSALAGRVVSRRGQRYAFALLMNGTSNIAGARAVQDRVVNLLAAGAEDLTRAHVSR